MKRFFLIVIFLFLAFTAYAQEQEVFIHEDFVNLENWKPLDFPKIKNHSSYTVASEGTSHYLKTQSNASASAIIYKKPFDVYQFPILRWQWKVDNIYKKGDGRTKAGDDYPLRIYVIFTFDSRNAGLFEKIKYKAAKLLYDGYPPHSSLNYVWANKTRSETISTSRYTPKIKSISLQAGESNLGKWMTETVNVLKDYQKAFGEKPPVIASLAIMNDSDNTGEKSMSYLKFIEIRNLGL